VVDDHDFFCAEEVGRTDGRTQGIGRDEAPCIPKDMRIAWVEPQDLLDGDSFVHASHDKEPLVIGYVLLATEHPGFTPLDSIIYLLAEHLTLL
jgi:hypothetical protein